MRSPTLRIPVAILHDPTLSATVKLLYICRQLDPTSPPSHLARQSGLDRRTVLRSLPELEQTSQRTVPGSASATIPLDLLLDPRMGARPKLLYGSLQLLPSFIHPSGKFTYPDLSALAGLSLNTVKMAVRRLQHSGWLAAEQKNKAHPFSFTLRNPVTDRRTAAVRAARSRIRAATFKGEAIMREYLSVLIDCNEYDDDASPGYLINPATGHEMQFDRYYPPSVAFEFQGDQHFSTTEKYDSVEAFKQQQLRDTLKQGICYRRGITLVEVGPLELRLDVMRKKVSDLLPLRNLADYGHLIRVVEAEAQRYRREYLNQARRGSRDGK